MRTPLIACLLALLVSGCVSVPLKAQEVPPVGVSEFNGWFVTTHDEYPGLRIYSNGTYDGDRFRLVGTVLNAGQRTYVANGDDCGTAWRSRILDQQGNALTFGAPKPQGCAEQTVELEPGARRSFETSYVPTEQVREKGREGECLYWELAFAVRNGTAEEPQLVGTLHKLLFNVTRPA